MNDSIDRQYNEYYLLRHRLNEVDKIYKYIPEDTNVSDATIKASKNWIAGNVKPDKIKWVSSLFVYIFSSVSSSNAHHLINYLMHKEVIEKAYKRGVNFDQLINEYNRMFELSSPVKRRRVIGDEADPEGGDNDMDNIEEEL